MTNSLETQAQHADKLIKKYAFGSAASGFVPIPWMDVMTLIYVQRMMLYRLSKLYGIPFSRNFAKSALATLIGGVMPASAAPIAGRLLKMIPGIGTLAGGASMAALGSVTTYAVGKVFQKHFENGGDFQNLDREKMQEQFAEELEKGKHSFLNV